MYFKILRNYAVFPLKSLIIFLCFILLFFGIGCSSPNIEEKQKVSTLDPQESEQSIIQQEYTIQELAQEAVNSVAYIEVYKDGYLGYHSLGSGFVINSDGTIVTNYHVIEGATSARIEVGKEIFEDKIIILAAEEAWDLAIIKVDAKNLPVLPLGAGVDAVGLGEQVIALGNPQGMKGTVSDGIVSTVKRDIGLEIDLIQTTAPISKGSSGGPLLNMRGEVIGVTSISLSSGQNLNFAIPVDFVKIMLSYADQDILITDYFRTHTKTTKNKHYSWEQGELAVVLQWEDPVDLDLEIWSKDFNFVGTASSLNESPDVYDGEMGEEWFVFRNEFSSGRYVISVYFYDVTDIFAADVSLVVYLPDGQTKKVQGSVLNYHPFDQWHALLIDADNDTFKVLDFFFDAKVIALLEWDTDVDLDLMIWDHIYDDMFSVYDIDGMDSVDGTKAVEIFRFGDYEVLYGFDFSYGLMDIFVSMDGPIVKPTNATLHLIHNQGLIKQFNHRFTPDDSGDYFWHVASDFDPHTLQYHIPLQQKVYYD